MTTTPLSEAEFAAQFTRFDDEALRLELQPMYAEPGEAEAVARYMAGDPQDPTQVPGLSDWCQQVEALTRRGKRIERVRVHEHPPTDYQRWERWIGQWNTRAGERINYMTRSRAHEIGLLPQAGDTDWWLLDSSELIVMRFDASGARRETALVTDAEAVDRACALWDLAVRDWLFADD